MNRKITIFLVWVIRWSIKNSESPSPHVKISIDIYKLRVRVMVKLKKEFHSLEIPTCFKYTCNVKKETDNYNPVITIR